MLTFLAAPTIASLLLYGGGSEKPRPRTRDASVVVCVLPAGRLNAITDVAGVEVCRVTRVKGEDVSTGVTAVLPHPRQSLSRKGARRRFRARTRLV